jgi:hypothetical protein
MRVVHLHPSTQHSWPQLSVYLSFVLSASPIATQLGPVRFSKNKGARKKSSLQVLMFWQQLLSLKRRISGFLGRFLLFLVNVYIW